MINPSGDKFRNVMLMYSILAIGTFLGAVIFIVVGEFVDLRLESISFQKNAVFIAAAISLVCIFLASKTYNTGIQHLKEQGRSSAEKFTKYIAVLMKFLVWCEAGTMLCCIIYLFSGDPYVLFPAAAPLFYMLSKKPTRARIFNDLELDSKEQMDLI